MNQQLLSLQVTQRPQGQGMAEPPSSSPDLWVLVPSCSHSTAPPPHVAHGGHQGQPCEQTYNLTIAPHPINHLAHRLPHGSRAVSAWLLRRASRIQGSPPDTGPGSSGGATPFLGDGHQGRPLGACVLLLPPAVPSLLRRLPGCPAMETRTAPLGGQDCTNSSGRSLTSPCSTQRSLSP